MDGTVLVADDDRTIRTVLTQALTRAGCKVHATSSLVTLMRWVEEGKGDLVISDVIMPDGNGLEQLPKIGAAAAGPAGDRHLGAEHDHDRDPGGRGGGLRLPAQALRPARPDEARRPRARRQAARAGRAAAATSSREGEADLPLVGRTPAMQALYRLVARIMNTDASRSRSPGNPAPASRSIARAIHDFSDRRTLPFVMVTRGRPRRALDGPATVLARARGGQPRLRRGRRPRPRRRRRGSCGCSTAWATGRRGSWRRRAGRPDRRGWRPGASGEDLFYRLSGVTVAVPSLRERVDDIPLLAEHFLGAGRAGRRRRRAGSRAAAMDLVRAYSWPGNVRQLENAIRRLVVTSGRGGDRAAPRSRRCWAASPRSNRCGRGDVARSSRRPSAKHLRRYFDLHGGVLPPPGLYDSDTARS